MANKPNKPALSEAEKAAAQAKRKAEKAAKFMELAPKRMDAALAKIRLIGNLASKSGYDYTPEQVAKMKQTLTGAVDSTLARFEGDGAAKSDGFTF